MSRRRGIPDASEVWYFVKASVSVPAIDSFELYYFIAVFHCKGLWLASGATTSSVSPSAGLLCLFDLSFYKFLLANFRESFEKAIERLEHCKMYRTRKHIFLTVSNSKFWLGFILVTTETSIET